MLAFKRLENWEYPLRMLTRSRTDQSYVHIQTTANLVKQQTKDVYSRGGDELTRENQYEFPYILGFFNLIQIESYMKMWGAMGGGIGE